MKNAASPAHRTRLAPTPMARAASWFVALAAMMLIAASLGSYFYHRRQLDSIAAGHLRLVVTGPGELHAGMPSVYNLLATTVTGEARAAQVQWSLSTPDGRRLIDRQEMTDDHGRLTMVVPADMDLPVRARGPAQLTIIAGEGAGPPSVAMPLPIRPQRYLTRLWLDRRTYRPGDTVYFRSLSVSRYSLAARDTLPLEFEILDSHAVGLPGSRIDGLTDHGVGNGSFHLPESLPAGTYTLVTRGFNGAFPEERISFEIVGAAQPQFHAVGKFARDDYGPGDDVAADLTILRLDSKPAAGVSLKIAAKLEDQTIFQKISKADDNGKLRVEFALPRQADLGRGELVIAVEGGDRSETARVDLPLRSGGIHVDLFPAGGRLSAGIENRVYVAAGDAKGHPLEIRGELVDGKGARVARVKTIRGLGAFSISPDAAETYRLKIASPAGVSESPLVPQASSDQPVAMDIGRGVIAPGAPLEVTIRAAKNHLPLVIAARMRGLLVGQELLTTSSHDRHAEPKTVSIPLDDQLAGVIRVTVYDYTKSPPRVLAEQWVYRRPRRLIARAVDGMKPAGAVSLSIQNEKGQPVAAVVGLTAFEAGDAKTDQADAGGPDLLHALFFDGELANPAAIEGIDLNISDDDGKAATDDGVRRSPLSPAKLLELALGCQLPSIAAADDNAKVPSAKRELPPRLFDNLSELRAEYQATLSDYREKRTNVVNALIMLSFFGGLALALLVTMLALLRIVRGSRLWLPTVVATLCCVVVTTVSNDPSRMKPIEAEAVGFAPWSQNPDADAIQQDQLDPGDAKQAETDNRLRLLAEKVSKMEGDAEQLSSDRFVVRQYTPSTPATTADGDPARPLAWLPLLVAGADGRITIPAIAVVGDKALRLVVNMHGGGRVGSCVIVEK